MRADSGLGLEDHLVSSAGPPAQRSGGGGGCPWGGADAYALGIRQGEPGSWVRTSTPSAPTGLDWGGGWKFVPRPGPELLEPDEEPGVKFPGASVRVLS